VTQGCFTREGEFVAVGTVNTDVIEELFRRLVLTRLTRAERLSEGFRDNLLNWVHSGFSVHAGPRICPTDPEYLARLGRYIVRVPMPSKDVRLTHEGQVRVTTPPDPRTGKTQLDLDPLDWIHAVTQQIPAPRQHMARYYGAYSNRKRKAMQSAVEEEQDAAAGTECGPGTEAPEKEDAHHRPRASWARLLHKIFEIDPLLCPECGTAMKVVSVITEPGVIDKILKHIARTGRRDPFEGRGPPAEAADPMAETA